jgi:hypothetical protein
MNKALNTINSLKKYCRALNIDFHKFRVPQFICEQSLEAEGNQPIKSTYKHQI